MDAENTSLHRTAALTSCPTLTGGDPHEELARDLGIGAPGFTTRRLAADPESLRQAREFVRDALDHWGLRTCADDVALVAGELMSNAVCHGIRPEEEQPAPAAARLGLARQEGSLVCAVTDPSPEVPVLRRAEECVERGRGLRIIDALSSSWGWSRPTATGKTVWARIAVPPAPEDQRPTSAVHADASSRCPRGVGWTPSPATASGPPAVRAAWLSSPSAASSAASNSSASRRTA